MRKTQSPSPKTAECLTLSELAHFADGWILDAEVRMLSHRTKGSRRDLLDKLLWFLRHHNMPECGTFQLRAFFAYVRNGHETEGGRWNNARAIKPVKPGTVFTYHRILRAFFNFIVSEEGLSISPMNGIAPPTNRADQIQPFSEEQVTALLNAAKRSQHPKRDEALLLTFLDTGLRVSELTALRISDLDMKTRQITVENGKGGKARTVPFGAEVAKALWKYLSETPREPDDVLFQSDRGANAGENMTPNGVYQLLLRIGKVAGVKGVRVSPHTFRHTFAISFLMNGGNQFSLMTILGHTDLTMTAKYVKLASADVAAQHRQYSPVDNRKKGTGR